VRYEGSGMPTMDVFPNPSKSGELNIRIYGLKNMETVPVVVYDQLGRECKRLLLNVDQTIGMASRSLSHEEKLPAGMYLVKAGQALSLTTRILVLDQ